MSTAKPADARHPPAPPAEALLHHVVSSRGLTDDGFAILDQWLRAA